MCRVEAGCLPCNSGGKCVVDYKLSRYILILFLSKIIPTSPLASNNIDSNSETNVSTR
jgi:hypothetical protein